jgi:hypothetical protein
MLTLALNRWEKGKHLKHPSIRVFLVGRLDRGRAPTDTSRHSVWQIAGRTVLRAESGLLALGRESERKHPAERLRAQRTVLPVDVLIGRLRSFGASLCLFTGTERVARLVLNGIRRRQDTNFE